MKKISLILLIFSSLITSCDRDTLKGLNLKINAEVKSDYDEQTTVEENTSNSTTKIPVSEVKSSVKTTSVTTDRTEDADAPIPFKQINDCSEAGIRAKTNEIFYSNNSQVKSIDSKNERQVKEWKKVYQKVSQSCK